MLVNKCDNCRVELKEIAEFPEWIHVTSQSGIVVTLAGVGAVKFQSLDFCNPKCAEEFFGALVQTMREAKESNVVCDERSTDT